MKSMIDTKTVLRKVVMYVCTMFLLVFVTNINVFAQRTVTVEQGVGTLNEAITSDTTATGARVDSNTVYVLSSGGTYLLDGSIEHRGYHLTIVAEDGATERPKLIPAVDDGGASDRPFRPRGDLTLKGLYMTNEDELGGINTRIIRISENEVTISIDDCHLDKDGQAGFRVDGDNVNIFLTNSILSNIGSTSSPDNGRGVDDRGNPIDTLWFENNTFYNLTSQVLRDGGGTISYAYINQNTAVNIGKNTAFEFGPTVNGVFTNNMVYNASFFGNNTNGDEQITVIGLDSLTTEETLEFGTQSFLLNNNNFYTSTDVVDAYPDSVEAADTYNATALAYVTEQGSASTNLNEEITFTTGTASPANVVTQFWSNAETPDEFPTSGEPFDFGYVSTAASFTGGDDGQQIGSLIWHGGITISNEDDFIKDTPNSFVLKGNYPNPFNPTTNISFDLESPSTVSIEVFSIIGQKVMTIPAQRMSAGANQSIMLDASGLSSGMYIYRVKAVTANNTFVNTSRMTLIK
ncbi:MAG: T9SS type A sorting domain-containing protein [Balneola sp.]